MKAVVIVTGPTGIGKTSLSIRLAQYFNSEIISADSRQIYQEMSIGTAVPSKAELSQIKHHLIQHVSIKDYYNVSRFEQESLNVANQLLQKNPIVFLTGGTGLYIDAFCKGIDQMPDPNPEIRQSVNQLFNNKGIEALQDLLKECDPEYYKTVDLNNQARLIRAIEVYKQTGKPISSFHQQQTLVTRPFKIIKLALDMPRADLYSRINNRVLQMLNEGLIEEAKRLFPYRALSALKTVGYQELFSAFEGQISIEEGVEQIQNHSRKYARKQLSWIRRDSEFQWFLPDQFEEIKTYIKDNI
ncbi:MAG: tRNA (adenosine(37)-N6)-dimethylallyltransferase MiaA [Bacteroidales bacterium]|nr:tRNA (adenosine(37)-N6)-dimethylallyltransferase MiaA [Bacteroidales bacterium]